MARRRGRSSPLLRLAGRIALTVVACAVLAFGSMEFAQRIGQNLALAQELARSQHDIRALHARKAEQLREMRRMQRPEGLVPYIYRRMRMVKPGQTLIYLVPAPSATP
jgi:hypothetical protein